MITPRNHLAAARAGYGAITKRGRTDAASLQAVVDAVCCPDTETNRAASTYLTLLTADYPEARDALLKMSDDPRWYVRARSMSLHTKAPRDLALSLARKGLADRTARVRKEAADLAASHELTELLPELDRLAQVEKSEGAKESLHRAVGLLRDGYFLKPWGPGRYYLDLGHGSFAGVSEGELKEKGIQAIVAKHRRPKGYRV
jgi:hypothetical protein